MKQSEETEYKKAVLRSHNIDFKDGTYWCNDGDGFNTIWEALEHTIWLDLMTKRIKTADGDRDCNDYYELIHERPSHQSIEEDKKVK